MKLGDIVQLKSGGPKMTVNYQTQAPPPGIRWGCAWFGTDGTFPLQTGVFAEEALNLIAHLPLPVPIGSSEPGPV